MTEPMIPVQEIAHQLDIDDKYVSPYGLHAAKLRLGLLDDPAYSMRGKLIMVTAVTPTTYGEGKTVTTIGLTQGIAKIGKRPIATLREPSLGPVFGLKGGATGGGKSRVLPAERINLHFTGDLHAITSAHNLLAAALDAHLHHGNELGLDVNNIFWPRTLDMNDRALRRIVSGLGGKANGIPRETGFVITAASEIMAILALATSYDDLRRRLDEIALGFDLKGNLVRAGDLKVTGAMLVLLKEALMPNLVQTTEHVPALVHAGPFANIAHGTSSVLSQRMGLGLADYVVNESGFGADLGAEKFFDIVMPSCGHTPSVAVVVATVKALAAHGGYGTGEDDMGKALRKGLCNLERHLANLKKFGVPVVVAINRFEADRDEEVAIVQSFCREAGVESAPSEVFARGGEGAIELAEKVTAIADASDTSAVHPLYAPELGLEEKIERIAREIYGAGNVYFEAGARRKLRRFTDLGFGHFPICMAKTPASFSDNPKLLGAPEGWPLTISDANLSAGAGFVVAVAGAMMLMPGLPKAPQALAMDLDEEGNVIGMS